MIKECFITTGATAKFTELIQAALSPECLQAFVDNGFTRLNFQCGESMSAFEELKPTDTRGLEIHGFGFNKNGLTKEMRACQEKESVSRRGLVICHAGAGTILDAMRLAVPLVVVPNSSLLDNHQEELAAELETQGYATKADIRNLAEAIAKACKKEEKAWGGHNTSFAAIVDNVVGYEDDVRAQLD
ncbi:glycosyl transferase [Leptodontidium sp. 2 PMI_412]|nr:glycosyl transferase [Leptodontidium sp. MPI-SDFR-AT-0119]KAH9218875.1 glycosyl transferase [Leptodontidium sp. 2 PMI_412]